MVRDEEDGPVGDVDVFEEGVTCESEKDGVVRMVWFGLVSEVGVDLRWVVRRRGRCNATDKDCV